MLNTAVRSAAEELREAPAPFRTSPVAAPTRAEARTRAMPEHPVYAIGDIHGCADLLRQLLARIHADCAQASLSRSARLVVLGDCIDRGADSRATLDILNRLKARLGDRCELLLGNHERALLDFLDDPVAGRAWLSMGGLATLDSYGVRLASVRPSRIELRRTRGALLRAMGGHVRLLQDGFARLCRSGNVLFAHAGIDPSAPIDMQSDAALLWGLAPRFGGASAPEGYVVVRGHHVVDRPQCRNGVVSIDTCAYRSGRLTAIRLGGGPPALLST